MTNENVELADRLLPILKEYELTDVLIALSFHLAHAVAIAGKAAPPLNKDLQIALQYVEKRTFEAHEQTCKML